MRIGIGLPAAVPGTDATSIGRWASESEELGFHSLGVIDRLVCDNLAEAGADDLVLLPCSGDPEQIRLLAKALDETRA